MKGSRAKQKASATAPASYRVAPVVGDESTRRRKPATQTGGTVTRKSVAVPVRRAAVATSLELGRNVRDSDDKDLAPVVGAGIRGVRSLKQRR